LYVSLESDFFFFIFCSKVRFYPKVKKRKKSTTYPRFTRVGFEKPMKNRAAIVKRYVYLKIKANIRIQLDGSATVFDFE